MKKSGKFLTGVLGLFMLIPGLAKFSEPFKMFIYKQLTLIGFPFPDFMQYVVKFSEVGIGIFLIYIAFKGNKLSSSLKNKLFYYGNLTVVIMMLVAVYTHLHPAVPAEILPEGIKPPYLPIFYLLIVLVNIYFNRKSINN